MSGERDHGDDFNVTRLGVAHEPADDLLRVEAAIFLIVRAEAITVRRGRSADGADGGKLGVFLGLETPTLVVIEDEAEAIELMKGEKIDVSLEIVIGNDAAGDIELDLAGTGGGVVLHQTAGHV